RESPEADPARVEGVDHLHARVFEVDADLAAEIFRYVDGRKAVKVARGRELGHALIHSYGQILQEKRRPGVPPASCQLNLPEGLVGVVEDELNGEIDLAADDSLHHANKLPDAIDDREHDINDDRNHLARKPTQEEALLYRACARSSIVAFNRRVSIEFE